MSQRSDDVQHLSAAEKRELLIKLLQEQKAKGKVNYPPSFGQKALWFIQQVFPESSAFNESFAWRLKAQLDDEQGLEIARLLSERHAILRTTYQLVQGKPTATVHSTIPLDFASMDAHDWDENQLRNAMQDHANRPIDLQTGPVLRLRLFRRQQELIWMTTIHHIAIDMSSMMILMEDIKTILACKMTGQPIPSWPVASYDEFAKWQAEFVGSPEGNLQRDFWLKQLGTFPALKLPTDYPSVRSHVPPAASQNFRIARSKSLQLERLAKEQGTTLYALLLSVFQILLGRYSSQDRFLIGSVVSGRTQAKFQRAIGLFANPIAIPADQSENPTFAQYLHRTRQFLIGALANQDYPFSLIVEQLSPQGELGRSPLVNVAFILQNPNRTGLEEFDPFSMDPQQSKGLQSNMGGTGVEIIPIFQHHAKFDLRLEMFQAGDELMGMMHYDSSLFDESTITCLVESFETLIDSVLADPNELIDRLNILGPSSKRIVQEPTQLPSISRPNSFLENWSETARLYPESIAIEEGDRRWSYAEFKNYVDWIAGQISRETDSKNEIVAILAPRSACAVAAQLACWRSGRIALFLDLQYPESRLQYMLRDAQPRCLLTTKDLQPLAWRLQQDTTESLHASDGVHAMVIEIDDDRFRDAMTATGIERSSAVQTEFEGDIDPEAIAYLIYTSGSTGNPKGVAISHRGLNNVWIAMSHVMEIRSSDRIFQTASFGFDASIADFVQALGNGATLILANAQPMLVGEELWDSLRSTRATIATLSPSVLATLPQRPLPDLRCLLSASEECGRELVQYWSKGRTFFNAYGPTETSVCATMHRCQPESRKPAIGRAIPNVQVYVMDRLMQPQPIGGLGEICIGGEGVARGYWNQAELTRQKFVSVAVTLGQPTRLYRTGDLGRWRSDGVLEFHGRRDQQIKLRGMRIELEEVEHAMHQVGSFKQIALVGGKEFQDQIVAFAVKDNLSPIDHDGLLDALRSRLPSFMIPRAILAVPEIPMTPHGKADRARLVQLWRQQGATKLSAARHRDYTAPRDEMESQIAAIFSEVLSVEKVGVHDDFFELGGHSLLAAELAAKLRPLATASVPLYLILANPTVAGVAGVLSGRTLDPNTETDLDLKREAQLDLAIRPNQPTPSLPAEPHFLLTGSTGFLGAHLLVELLKSSKAHIHCLVRASTKEEGLERILAKCSKLGLGPIDANRLMIEPGDLASPQLGLSDERFEELASVIDVIYHNGALVNFSMPYRQLRAANVMGTETVLRLACSKKTKPVHYVSTLSVFPAISLQGEAVYRETDPLVDHQSLFDGYSQSKWVAEKLVQEAGKRGLPYTIYRPGRITGDSRTGIGESEDLLWSIVRQCVQVGIVPSVEANIDMTPVDYVSQAIVLLSSQPATWNKIYHLLNPQPMAWKRIVELLRERGHIMQPVDVRTWKERMEKESPDLKFTSLLAMLPQEMIPSEDPFEVPRTTYDAKNTLQTLSNARLTCPVADDHLLGLYLESMKREGALVGPDQLPRQ